MQPVENLDQPALLAERVMIARGHYGVALARLSRQASLYSNWAEPWALMAQALSLCSRFSEALTAADEALKRDTGHLFAQQLKTGLLLQLGFYDVAQAAAERLVALRPDRPESHAFVSFAHAFAGHEREALIAARRCKRMAPHRGSGHQALCVVHLTFRRWDKAERHALAALQLEGPIASVFHDLGVALYEQRRYTPAYQAFKRAAELDPRFAGSLARLLSRTGPRWALLPVVVTLACGVALVPLSNAPTAFIAVAIVGISALLAASRLSGRALAPWIEHFRPALAVVLFFDVAMVAMRAGVFG